MKTIFLSTMILLGSIQLFGQRESFIPKQWDKSFVISLSHTGAMKGGTSRITFTYDSCTYVTTSLQDSPTKHVFALTKADRDQILKKMHELGVSKIKAGMSIAVENDGWSDLLCFGLHCIEGGSSSKMTDKEKELFWNACRYLESFVSNK